MSKTFTLAEVSKHKVTKGADKSIWIVLHDKVYDVTKFLDEVTYFAYKQAMTSTPKVIKILMGSPYNSEVEKRPQIYPKVAYPKV